MLQNLWVLNVSRGIGASRRSNYLTKQHMQVIPWDA